MGGQTDSWVGYPVHASPKSCKFPAYTVDLRTTCVDLRWVAKRWNTCVQIWAKSTKIIASGWPNETQVERKSKTCVDLRRLVSPFGQDFRAIWHINYVSFPLVLTLSLYLVVYSLNASTSHRRCVSVKTTWEGKGWNIHGARQSHAPGVDMKPRRRKNWACPVSLGSGRW